MYAYNGKENGFNTFGGLSSVVYTSTSVEWSNARGISLHGWTKI